MTSWIGHKQLKEVAATFVEAAAAMATPLWSGGRRGRNKISHLVLDSYALVGHSARAGSAAMLLADAQAKLDREGGRILLVTCVANQKVKACRYSSCLSIAS